jgi:lipopolysaccharide export system permease protein
LFGRLDRYVLREVAVVWVAVTGVLLVILVSNQLARILGIAAEKGFPQEVVLTLIGLTSLQNLAVIVPVATLLAVMMALGRLYHESEMAAVRACGMGPERLYVPVLAFAAVVALALSTLAFDLGPAAYARAMEVRQAAIREAEFGRLEAGKFRSFAGGTAVFYAERADGDGTLHNVFLQRQVGDRVEVATASRAVHRIEQGGRLHVVVLYDGERVEGVPGEAGFRRLRFAEHGIPVRIPEPDAGRLRVGQMTMAALRASPDPEAAAELHWRIAQPVMVLTLALLAVPLSALRPREGRYARVAVGILVYFVYSQLVAAGQVWIEKGDLDPRFGLWWAHALVLALALVLLHRQSPLHRLTWARA